MSVEPRNPPGFWTTVGLLLGASRKRAGGRRKRQSQLLRSRAGKSAFDWGCLGAVFVVLFGLGLHVLATIAIFRAFDGAQFVEAEIHGKILVNRWFINDVKGKPDGDTLDEDARIEASEISTEYGGDKEAIQGKLISAVHAHGAADFVARRNPGTASRAALLRPGSISAMFGSMIFLGWGVMLVCQGEGLELDLQRRRHPMWEWLFSHPVRSGPVFLAEMLSPIAANPVYWGTPIFVGSLYGFVYGAGPGIVAALVIGIPVMIAAACLGKALEIGIILRFSSRSRGAMIGIMSWLGYALTMFSLIGAIAMPQIVATVGRLLAPLAILPWPWLGLFLGEYSSGSFSFSLGLIICWFVSAAATAGAVTFSIWGAQQGLGGNFGGVDALPAAANSGKVQFGKDPLYRKEILWFLRDRSAIVQTILIPLTVSSYQLFNMRRLLYSAGGAWNYLCGSAILFGTYFLWVLGPKSLLSEGTALWIPLTWPRGLESLLKAKAWLWSIIASGIVAIILCFAAFLFPASTWKIALVGIGWFFFSRSMAEKTVTLVAVTSSSGEAQKIPRSRRWAASLGMLTFAIGVFTQQWNLAIAGIVYSYLTAAAMWENFRARLPYLYDPWSEKLPPPPTLMHAMIAISLLVEGGAVMTGIVALFFGGMDNILAAQPIAYCISAVIISVCMSAFLANRDVPPGTVWYWNDSNPALRPWKFWQGAGAPVLTSLALGILGGLALGLFAQGYTAVLHHFAFASRLIDKTHEQFDNQTLRISYAVAAVGFAPFAEEFLFRGLLFKALDREWGGWRAVLGSGAFFAIYHPPLAWLPVAMLGVTNALLFKKTGRLAPAVLLHMTYNAVVMVWT